MALRLGTETASLTNHLMSGSAQPPPEVGMGATICAWTDRYAGTVIKVGPYGKTVIIQEDKAERTDNNGMSESQHYSYSADPNGRIFKARYGKRGWRVIGGGYGVVIGTRCKYHDYSF